MAEVEHDGGWVYSDNNGVFVSLLNSQYFSNGIFLSFYCSIGIVLSLFKGLFNRAAPPSSPPPSHLSLDDMDEDDFDENEDDEEEEEEKDDGTEPPPPSFCVGRCRGYLCYVLL